MTDEETTPTSWTKSKTALGWWAVFALVVQQGISYKVFKSLLNGPEGDLSDLVDVVNVAVATLPLTGVGAAWLYGMYTKKVQVSGGTLVLMAASLAVAGALSNSATSLPEAVMKVQGIEAVQVTGPSSLSAVLKCYVQTYGATLFVLALAAAAFFAYVAAVWADEL
ncbi:MAG: hypothetical protein ACXV8V_14625 [Ilumatobacteraceae bacterium]